jgi:hypothetical protein
MIRMDAIENGKMWVSSKYADKTVQRGKRL